MTQLTELATFASTANNSRGRRFNEPPPEHRSEFQRDRDRIVHSAAFRRLEYKTQVFVNHEGDMFRTRLTHSIEVAQIARSVARILGVNEVLAETIALAHDLGHTPFGHAGQDALNQCMRGHGGFEHNLQSLRIVDQLEEKYAEFDGLNLTFETREGILKHCSTDNARQLGELGERFLQKQQPGLEAQITNIADEIAYNNHDIDDGLRAGLIDIEQLCEVQLFREQHQTIMTAYPGLQRRRAIHEIIRRMINRQVTDLIETSRDHLATSAPQSRDDILNQPTPLAGFSEPMQAMNRELKRFLRNHLYRHYRVHRMTSKAHNIVRALFHSFLDDALLLPPEAQRKAATLEIKAGVSGRARAVADYIAGMTDRYAIQEYERIFTPAKLT
ncbi:dNTP triphosphohydrolase, broad substrate specificity [hydrothermal vent metagenome]|uniref:DNTP triphosphohydrolase, broad substrate specificity n=1 Tax=hydrothermal vent metagenome TaxID=652676 RepID=A0A3B0ZYD0_9ZZZZ